MSKETINPLFLIRAIKVVKEAVQYVKEIKEEIKTNKDVHKKRNPKTGKFEKR